MYFSRINIENYNDFINFNVSFINDGVHDTIVNIRVDNNVTLFGCTIVLVGRKPDSPTDTKYSREHFRVTVNLEKFLKGNRGSSLAALLIDQAFKFMDFELKFPLKKVRVAQIHFES